jgi:DNA invertase Pin-like site-specific DNA recombinase
MTDGSRGTFRSMATIVAARQRDQDAARAAARMWDIARRGRDLGRAARPRPPARERAGSLAPLSIAGYRP